VSVADGTKAPSVLTACDQTADGEGCALVISDIDSDVPNVILGVVSERAVVDADDCD
jgi:hypothetical protein